MQNANNTGHIASPAPLSNETFWSFAMGTPLSSGVSESAPAVNGLRVYIGGMDGYLYCLNVYTGVQIWRTWLAGTIRSSPAVAYDRVYVGWMINRCIVWLRVMGTLAPSLSSFFSRVLLSCGLVVFRVLFRWLTGIRDMARWFYPVGGSVCLC